VAFVHFGDFETLEESVVIEIEFGVAGGEGGEAGSAVYEGGDAVFLAFIFEEDGFAGVEPGVARELDFVGGAGGVAAVAAAVVAHADIDDEPVADEDGGFGGGP
jgi:hypothetical protein